MPNSGATSTGRPRRRESTEKHGTILREARYRNHAHRSADDRSCGTSPCATTRRAAADRRSPPRCRPKTGCRARARKRHRARDRPMPTAAARRLPWETGLRRASLGARGRRRATYSRRARASKIGLGERTCGPAVTASADQPCVVPLFPTNLLTSAGHKAALVEKKANRSDVISP